MNKYPRFLQLDIACNIFPNKAQYEKTSNGAVIVIIFVFRPRYRYPYYDENGKGKLLYGYGGPELYQYKTYSALEGIH